MTEVRRPTRDTQPALPDAEWLEVVFREHYIELCAFVHGYVGSDDVSEDIVQDLFLTIWADPDRWRRDGDRSPRFLLYVAARNRALDHLKHRKVRERHARNTPADLSHTDPTALDDLTAQEVQKALDHAIESLPARAREVFLSSRREGLTYREIAERLGISIKTVETQMSRSLKRLRAELSTYLALLVTALLG